MEIDVETEGGNITEGGVEAMEVRSAVLVSWRSIAWKGWFVEVECKCVCLCLSVQRAAGWQLSHHRDLVVLAAWGIRPEPGALSCELSPVAL